MSKRGAIGRIPVIGLAVVLAACTTRGGHIPHDVADFHAPDAPKLAAVDDAYKLSPRDIVTIGVFQVPDLSHDYIILQSSISPTIVSQARRYRQTISLPTRDLGRRNRR